MKKKLISAVLAGLMLASVTACSKSTDSVDSKTTTTKKAEETTNNDGGDTADVTENTEPVKPEYSEITVEVFDRGNQGGTDPTNNYYTDWIKAKVLEELNIGVSFVAVGRWTEEVDMTNLLASGSAPDLCFSYAGGMIQTFGDQGGITNLAPILDEMEDELPDLSNFLGDLLRRNADPVNGRILSMMSRRMNSGRCIAYIRKDWLDILGLSMPKTTEEFVDALRKFKSEDPGNVGKDKIIPLAMTGDVRWRASTLLESFIDPNLTPKDWYVYPVSNYNILFPGIKEGARLLNTMFNEGLIDPDFALYKDDEISDNLIKSGVVGASIHNWDQPLREVPGQILNLIETVPTAEFVPVDCFTNANGTTDKLLYDAAGFHMFIPSQSKNPEGVLRYLNWMCRLENRKYLQIGDEGDTHIIVDGIPVVQPVEGPKIMNSANNIDYTIPINGLDLGDDALTGKALAGTYPVDPKLVGDAYAVALNNGYMIPVITVENGLVVESTLEQTLRDKQQAVYCQSISAKPEDFDKVWDAGIADYLASGAQAAMDERSTKYPY